MKKGQSRSFLALLLAVMMLFACIQGVFAEENEEDAIIEETVEETVQEEAGEEAGEDAVVEETGDGAVQEETGEEAVAEENDGEKAIEETGEEAIQEDTVESTEQLDVQYHVVEDSGFVPVSTITLTGAASLKAGQSDYPTYQVFPDTASNQTLLFSSSDTTVATITSAGVVYAVGEGKTLIRADATDGSGVWAYYELNVTPAYVDNTRVTSIVLYGTSSLAVGATYATSYEVFPATATNKNINWGSSNKAVATVNEYGVVTGVAEGEAIITGYADDNSSIIDSYKVKVENKIPVTAVEVTATPSMTVGQVFYCSYAVYPANASDQRVIWSSSNSSVVSVDEVGKLTALKGGKAIITLKSVSDPNVYGSYAVNVGDIPATWIVLNGKTQLLVGETDAIAFSVFPATSTTNTLTWSSSNSAVVSVDTNGVMYGAGIGTAVITARANDSGNATAQLTVNVSKNASLVSSVTIGGPNTVSVSGGIQLTATVLPTNAYNKTLYWTSDNPAVAIVNEDGYVVGVAPGTALISATATDGTLKKGSYLVTVKGSVVLVTNVIAAGAAVLYPGAIDYAAYGILPASADDTRVTWSSSNTAVATVNEYGIVKAIAGGEATITATSCDGTNISGSYKVTVKPTINYVTKVSISGHPVLGVGAVDYLAYEIWPLDADNKAVTWSSSNPKVATVNADYGIVTALKKGSTVITAKAKDGSGKTASFTLQVSDVTTQVTRVEVYGSTNLAKGATDYVAYAIWPVDANNKSVTWTSSNTKVATVTADTGVVTAVAEGTTVITAKAKDGSGQSASYTLTVSTAVVNVAQVNVYGNTNLAVNVKEYLAYEILPVTASNKSVTWVSSNPAVAEVTSDTGVVTTKSAGTVVITATAADGSGASGSLTITVN